MEPRIETIAEKKLVGKCLKMSLSNNKTFELWQSFMPRRKEIQNNLTTDLFSLQTYNDSFDFQNFNPTIEFTKWALVEVSDYENIPENMEAHTLKGGLYAVFIHKGPASEGGRTFQQIFGSWLPNSEYDIDNRDHFEILGEKYKNNAPDSEEEVWIPIKRKE